MKLHPTLSAVLVLTTQSVRADNWPQWRGPDGTGISRETNLPLKWSASENVRWKAPLPGPGMSSPIVWGNRVFLTQSLDREGKRRALLCFDRKDGKQLWQAVTEFEGKESTYDGEKHFCSASPVTDGERVVVSFASAGIVCYDMNGKPVWKRELGPCDQIWGTAASPIIYQNLVIHNFGPGERTFLIALDKKTGKDVWKLDAHGKFGTTQPEWIGSWSTPVICRRDGRDELIMTWPDEVRAYEPRTGKLLWNSKGLGKLVYTSPLATADCVVAMSGFGGPAVALRRGSETGDITDTNRLWREEKAPQRIGSGVIVGEHLFRVNENGVAECLELKTGKALWSERATGTTWSSLVYADGKLYIGSQRGEVVVLAAKPSFEVLARNTTDERMQSSLAISNGELFIRTYNHLWCIGTAK
jgi:outer membrane protein assembly factor BamB